jgi:branched-chain amino acid transport system substrate-binding protein
MKNLKTKILATTILAFSTIGTGAALAADSPKCGLNNGTAATGEPIVIGAVVGQTGPDDFSSPAKSVKAYFDCVNANGGINGRPLKYLVRDDQWNPETAAQVAAQLVTDEKVVAMVGNSSFVECAANGAFYKKNGVISFSGAGVPRECFTADNIAAFNAGPRMSLIQTAQFAHTKLEAKSFVCLSLNIPGMGDWACKGVEDWAKANGMVSKTILVDPGSADATSTIIQAAAEKPDAILLGFAKGLAVAMLNAAEQQDLGGKIKFVAAGGGYNSELPAAAGAYWNDRFWVNLELNLLESTGEDNLNWQAVMNKYGAATDPRDTFSQAGYLAAKAATTGLLTLDPAKIDRASVAKAMSEVKGIKSDILCKDWYFGEGMSQHNAVHDTRMAILTGGAFKTITDCAPTEDAELAALLKHESMN